MREDGDMTVCVCSHFHTSALPFAFFFPLIFFSVCFHPRDPLPSLAQQRERKKVFCTNAFMDKPYSLPLRFFCVQTFSLEVSRCVFVQCGFACTCFLHRDKRLRDQGEMKPLDKSAVSAHLKMTQPEGLPASESKSPTLVITIKSGCRRVFSEYSRSRMRWGYQGLRCCSSPGGGLYGCST